ncbi:MAG: SDR family oxidoreductase [Gemmatimonadetes bacterium]|nr:SDR family oxidoreductase [Gemmatimonadota bacterium]
MSSNPATVRTGPALSLSGVKVAASLGSTAVELGPRRILVNCVCPGTIDTPINQQAGAEAKLGIVKTIAPLGRRRLYHRQRGRGGWRLAGRAVACADRASDGSLMIRLQLPIVRYHRDR